MNNRVVFVFSMLLIISLGIFVIILNNQLTQLSANNTKLVRQLDQSSKLLSSQKTQTKEKESELGTAQKDLVDMELQLQAKTQELVQTKTTLANTNADLSRLRSDFLEFRTEIKDLNDSLTDSIRWFKNNSELPSSQAFRNEVTKVQYEGFLQYAVHDCSEKDGSTTKIKLACVSFLMGKLLSFKYISGLLGENYGLYPISTSISRGGGDCKDFSLFLKAFLNFLKNGSTETDFVLEGMTPDSTHAEYIIYGARQSGDEFYYYPHYRGEILGTVADYPYVVCYGVDQTVGHCIVALSQKQITSVTDVNNLLSARTVEPQSGEYEGIIGTDFHLCKNGDEDCERTPRNIYVILSDDDIYQFKDGAWTSNAGYQTIASQLDYGLSKYTAN